MERAALACGSESEPATAVIARSRCAVQVQLAVLELAAHHLPCQNMRVHECADLPYAPTHTRTFLICAQKASSHLAISPLVLFSMM